jgi:hypothetical protein
VTEVLAPQGHVMLVTSRPASLDKERFRHHFVHDVHLEPLTEEQQKEVVVKRLGEGEHSELLEYLSNPERVPIDYETKQRVTGNPLMLSMVISIFQSKQGTGSAMPATITELYATASRAMLERMDHKERSAAASAAAVPHLTSLFEATFFQAHAAEVRDFGNTQLNRAALELFACRTTAELPTEAKEALRAVRERVAQDRLPLLSLLEAEPLLMRSSHLSFQEYFTVRAILTGKHQLPRESPPCGSGAHSGRTWSSWVVRMGPSLAAGSCVLLVWKATSSISGKSSVAIVRRCWPWCVRSWARSGCLTFPTTRSVQKEEPLALRALKATRR